MQLLIGFCLGAVIGFLAWRAGALSDSGALAAALTGGLIFGIGGWPWAALLLMFFVSSSGLSRLFTHRKAALDEKFAKGSRRDWGQVFANGGLGALLAVVYARFPDYPWVWAAYVGAMAAVNADTWSTELGVLSRTPPRLITSGKVVERGTSGGISFLGTLAALGGAVLIGVTAFARWGRFAVAGRDCRPGRPRRSAVRTHSWGLRCRRFITARPVRKRLSALRGTCAARKRSPCGAGAG